jgi:arginine decarboxylase
VDTPPIKAYAKQSSLERYGVDRWGQQFLRVNERGHLVYISGKEPVDLQALAEALDERGIHTPFLLRFPEVIETQMLRLNRAFEQARIENAVEGGHMGLYPLKVNPRRSVVDSVIRAQERTGFGLEVGSKPELLLAMSQPPVPGSVLLINGFKDREFIRMAYHAAELGHEVVVVLESTREVRRYLEVGREVAWKRTPDLGVRAKLYSRGSGRWQGSGGEASKFGLATNEILAVVGDLEQAGQLDRLVALHFHIGSQITQIKRIKRAVREGAWLYASLQTGRCPRLRYLDLGGGIGVDYDGSRTSYPSSANYTMEEYASQVVFEIGEVISATGARAPTILTESGRALVAQHAVLVADLREVQGALLPVPEPSEDEHRLIGSLRETLDQISVKNYEEYFHDAIDLRDESLSLFSSGYLGLEDRASAEGLFQRIRIRTAEIVDELAKPSEEIVDHLEQARRKYLANFSIFQSLPDSWSIDHVFPAAPLSRHGEKPAVRAKIVDITCDSDGSVDTFAHPDDNLPFLPLHERRDVDERYYLGFFLVGAYQESLSNIHNLFCRCHEVVVRDEDDDMILQGSERVEIGDDLGLEIKMGATNEDALANMDFDVESMLQSLRDRHLAADTTLGPSWALGLLQSYPYLTR